MIFIQPKRIIARGKIIVIAAFQAPFPELLDSLRPPWEN